MLQTGSRLNLVVVRNWLLVGNMCSKLLAFRITILGLVVALCCEMGWTQDPPANPLQLRRDKILIEAMLRLPKGEVKHDEKTNALVRRFLKSTSDGNMFLKVVEHCEPEGAAELLWDFGLSNKATDSTMVQAIEMCLNRKGKEIVEKWLKDNKSADKAHETVAKIALANHVDVATLLWPLVLDAESLPGVAAAAGQGMVRSTAGQKLLLESAKAGTLRGDVKTLVAGSLRKSTNEEIAKAAVEIFPLPMTKDQKPLPSIDDLAKRTGTPANGEKLFRSVATCSNCHIVKGFGKNVGPDLSEIGSKLTREAMFVAIVDPSAGISHNYESYILQTDSGDVATGLLVSQTEEEIVLKDAQGIERKFPRDEVEEFKKQEKSIMPENLHHNFDEQGLVDLVEYMLTLKKE
jgi:putative heme-binding domain-containing protein